MDQFAILAILHARPGKEGAVEEFLNPLGPWCYAKQGRSVGLLSDSVLHDSPFLTPSLTKQVETLI